MVSVRPLISKSPNPYINLLLTVPRSVIITGITVTFTSHNFFNSLARSGYLSLFLFSFNFTLWSTGTVKSTIRQVPFFLLLVLTRFGRLAKIRWSVFISKFKRTLWISFSRTDSWLRIYHLCPWCKGYRRRKWTRRHDFKSWTRLISFHRALIPRERYESYYSPSSYG